MSDSSFSYASQLTTAICQEEATSQAPFTAISRRMCGYDVKDLVHNGGWVETLVMLLTGEYPESAHSVLLERCLIGVMNLGPRDSATRAAMVAGVSKAHPQHILPIGLIAGGGDREGAASVARAHHFISNNIEQSVADVLATFGVPETFPPGFGQRYGNPDPLMGELLRALCEVAPHCSILRWVTACHENLLPSGGGILDTGLVAAVCQSVGIGPRESIGFYQIARAPGIFAQGVEQSHRPITAMPMLQDEKVTLERD